MRSKRDNERASNPGNRDLLGSQAKERRDAKDKQSGTEGKQSEKEGRFAKDKERQRLRNYRYQRLCLRCKRPRDKEEDKRFTVDKDEIEEI